jgi:hypothetical protein
MRRQEQNLYSTTTGDELADDKRIFYNTGGLSLRS